MSPALSATESQWISQLASMRAAISELKLSKAAPTAIPYGQDLLLDDEDILPIEGSDDLWDLISEISEEEYTSEEPGTAFVDQQSAATSSRAYDRDWLRSQCVAVSSRNSGLESNALYEQVEAILASDSNGKLEPFKNGHHY
jgi:antiviral helicase SLH1